MQGMVDHPDAVHLNFYLPVTAKEGWSTAVKENYTNEARANPSPARQTTCLPLTSAGVKSDPQFMVVSRKRYILQNKLNGWC